MGKLENILLAADGVKLGDFGWAVRSAGPRRTVCGTEEYFAPEMRARRPYGEGVDVWCLGVVAHELCLGRVPGKSLDGLGEKAKDFIASILVSASKRPNIHKV